MHSGSSTGSRSGGLLSLRMLRTWQPLNQDHPDPLLLLLLPQSTVSDSRSGRLPLASRLQHQCRNTALHKRNTATLCEIIYLSGCVLLAR